MLHKYLFGFVAEAFDLSFEEVDLLGDFRGLDRKEFVYDAVDIDVYLAIHGLNYLLCEE